MKVLVMDMDDDEGTGLDFALRAQDAGHEVKYWLPTDHPAGRGLVEKPRDWQAALEAADLTVLTGNCDYPEGLTECFVEGYPIFGTNPKAAMLELDRGEGQEALKAAGIKTLSYKVVSSAEEGMELIVKTGQAYALKPWGGEANKAMTCVPRSPEEAIFTLQRWRAKGLFSGQLMMQEMVEGVEVGVSAFFGPGGWSRAIEESFEHKKLMNGELGQNTGEQGTVIRHVATSKLFDLLLKPLTDYLQLIHYVGDVSVNCIVDKQGTPWPLEFTMRLGWPDFCIRQEVIQGDPVEWIVELLYGRDTLKVSSAVAVGVVMTHGDYPWCKDEAREWAGYPIEAPSKHVAWQQVMQGKAPRLSGGKLTSEPSLVTAGTYIGIALGSGKTVSAAQARAYKVADAIRWPSNVMYRTDIGDRLREDLPLLHKHGYATGMEF